jgi:hypothetical protein
MLNTPSIQRAVISRMRCAARSPGFHCLATAKRCVALAAALSLPHCGAAVLERRLDAHVLGETYNVDFDAQTVKRSGWL